MAPAWRRMAPPPLLPPLPSLLQSLGADVVVGVPVLLLLLLLLWPLLLLLLLVRAGGLLLSPPPGPPYHAPTGEY